MIKHQNKIIAQKALGRRAKNINLELRSTVAKQEAMTALQRKEFHARIAQQAKELEALTATLKEQASRKVRRHCGGETRCTGYLSWPER